MKKWVWILAVVVAYLLYQRPAWLFREGMENPSTKLSNPCPPGYEQCRSGDCRLASEVHSFCL